MVEGFLTGKPPLEQTGDAVVASKTQVANKRSRDVGTTVISRRDFERPC